MRIRKADLWEVETASAGRASTRYGPGRSTLPRVILRLADEAGREGWGEASPLVNFTGEAAFSPAAALRPALGGIAGTTPEEALAGLDALADFSHHTAARAGLEMALLDLACRQAGRPLAEWLGGARRSAVPTSRPLGISPPREAVRLARRFVDEGIRTLKVPVGRDPAADAERVRAVRTAFSEDVRVRADANGGFSPEQALDFAERIRDLEIEYLEQPVPPDTPEAPETFRVIREMGVRVATDESVFAAGKGRRRPDAENVDGAAIKIMKLGGLYPSRKAIASFEEAGKFIVVVSSYECHIGKAAGLALALTLGRCAHAQELGYLPFEGGFSEWSHRSEGGDLLAGPGNGHGARGIPEKLDSLARPGARLNPPNSSGSSRRASR